MTEPPAPQIVLPIGSYFVTLNHLYEGACTFDTCPHTTTHAACRSGNATYAGITAAVVANLVLGAYIAAALAEDRPAPVPSAKKTQ